MNDKVLFCNYIDEEYNNSSNFIYYSDDVEILHLEDIVYTLSSKTDSLNGTVCVSYFSGGIRTLGGYLISLLTHKIPKYILARRKLSNRRDTFFRDDYRLPRMEVHLLEPLQNPDVFFKFQLILKTKGKFMLKPIDLEGISKEHLVDYVSVYVNETPIEIELEDN